MRFPEINNFYCFSTVVFRFFRQGLYANWKLTLSSRIRIALHCSRYFTIYAQRKKWCQNLTSYVYTQNLGGSSRSSKNGQYEWLAPFFSQCSGIKFRSYRNDWGENGPKTDPLKCLAWLFYNQTVFHKFECSLFLTKWPSKKMYQGGVFFVCFCLIPVTQP